jgi:hypothetical protein
MPDEPSAENRTPARSIAPDGKTARENTTLDIIRELRRIPRAAGKSAGVELSRGRGMSMEFDDEGLQLEVTGKGARLPPDPTLPRSADRTQGRRTRIVKRWSWKPHCDVANRPR